MSCCSCQSNSNKSHKSCICFRIPHSSDARTTCFSQLIFNSGCPATPFTQTLTVAIPPCLLLPILPSSSMQLSVAPCSRPSTFTLAPLFVPVGSPLLVTLQSSGLIVPAGCGGCYAVDISVSLSVTIAGTGTGASSIVAVSLCSTMVPNNGMAQASFMNICGEASYTFAGVGTQGPVINISTTGIVNLVDGQIVTPCVQFKGVTLPVGSVINTYCTSMRLNRIGKPIN